MNPTFKAIILLLMIMPLIVTCLISMITTNMSYTIEWTLLSLGSTTITTPIILDKTTMIFSLTVITISLCVMMFSTSYMKDDLTLNYFIIMVMLFIFSMNLLIFSPSLFTLILGWDGLGLTSYLLVIYYNNKKSAIAGLLTVMINRIGDALIILAISWSMMIGHWNFSLSPSKMTIFISISIIIAAMTKSANLPFSVWLPAAMAAPTPVSALVHSSTLVTAGIFLIIRFYPSLSLFESSKMICFYLGALTCLMASLSATFETDLKKIIALSTLSQLGIMMIALGLQQPNLAFFHLITHALFKALLFICAGTLIHMKDNNQDIRFMGNLQYYSPQNLIFFNVANLSLCGTPFLAGFYSKDIIIESFFFTMNPLSTSIILLISVCMTAAYTMRLSFYSLWSSPKVVNTFTFCSKFTYLSYIPLYFGAIFTGASMNQIMFIQAPNLPFFCKNMALFLIISYAIIMWFNMFTVMPMMSRFNSTMWFLTLNDKSAYKIYTNNLAFTLLYNEETYMENFSGKGLNQIMKITNYIQKHSNTTFSEMMTTMSYLLIFLILMMI